jgi:hypothetical protein
MSAPYSVGYGKPPKKNQFQKGKSGNPRGRPKPKPLWDFQKKFITELKSTMTIFEGGKKKKITKLEALTKSIFARALQGDKAMAKLLLDFIQKLPKDAFADEGTVWTYQVSQAQLDCLEQFVAETSAYRLELDSSEQNTNS